MWLKFATYIFGMKTKLLVQASSPKEKKKVMHFAPFLHDLLLHTTIQHTAIVALEAYTVCSGGVGS